MDELIYKVRVEGTEKQAAQLNKVEAELKQVTEARNKLIKKDKEYIALVKEEEKTGKKASEQKKKELQLTKQEQQELTKLTQQQKVLTQQKKGLNAEITRTINLNKAQAKTLNQINAQLAQERQLIKNLVIGSKDFNLVASRIKKLEAQQRKVNQAIGRGSTFVGEYARGVKTAMVRIGAAVATAMIAWRGLNRLVGSNIDTFKEWQTGQVNVQTLLDKTDKTLDTRTIALIREHGLAIGDTNKALFDAVSAGVDSGKATDFLDKVSRLAIGGVTELGIATDGVTSIMNAYQLQIEETDRAASALFSGQRFGKTTVAELSSEIGRVAPIAKMADISYQELITTYAELTYQGIKTTDATTAIKATILAVIKPSEQARKKFRELGIEVGLNAVKNQGLFNVLTKISKAAEEDADALTELIPNVRALTGVGALGTEALEHYHKILKIVEEDYGENSSMARAYAMQMATLQKRFDVFQAKVRITRIELVQKLEPALIRGIELFETLGGWIKKNAKTILGLVKVIGIATGAYLLWKLAVLAWNKAAAISKGLTAALGVVTNAYKLVVARMTGETVKAAVAQKGLNAAMASNPFGIAIVAITTFIGLLTMFSKRTKAANQVIDETVKFQQRLNDTWAAERTLLEKRFDRLKAADKGSQEYNDALEDINTTYETYLPNLVDERDTLEEIEIAHKQVTVALRESLAERVRAELLDEKMLAVSKAQLEVNRLAEQIEAERALMSQAFVQTIKDHEQAVKDLFKAEHELLRTQEFLTEGEEKQADVTQKLKDNITLLEKALAGIPDKTSAAAKAIQEQILLLKAQIPVAVKVVPPTAEELEEIRKQSEELLKVRLQAFRQETVARIIQEQKRITATLEGYEKEITNVNIRNELIEESLEQHQVKLAEIIQKGKYQETYVQQIFDQQRLFETSLEDFTGTAKEKEHLYMEHYEQLALIIEEAEFQKSMDNILNAEVKKLKSTFDKEITLAEEHWNLQKLTLVEGSEKYLAALEEFLQRRQALIDVYVAAQAFQETFELEEEEEVAEPPWLQANMDYYAQDVNNLGGSLKQKKQLLKDYFDAGIILEDQYNKLVGKYFKQAVTDREKSMAALMATMEIAKGFVKEESIAFKALSIMQALISTYVAANRALSSAPPPFNYILMAAVIAQGLYNVAQIRKTKPEGMRYGGLPEEFIVPGTGGPTSDNIPVWLSSGEGIINARSMASGDQLTVSGTPRDIASQINTHKGYGRKFATGGLVPGVTTGGGASQPATVDPATITAIVQETVAGITHIPVVVVADHVSQAQRLTQVAETQGNL